MQAILLLSLLAVGFLSRLLPLLQYPRVGFDPLFHYEFSMALLNGKTSIAIETQLGEHLTLYYPPLFHLLSLSLFLLLPNVDPYLIMKVIVSLIDSLQILPIYYIVKDFSKSTAGAGIAAFVAMATPNDFHMISWGGYANIAGLLLMAASVYFIMKKWPFAAWAAMTTLFLTHHLSMLFTVAVFAPYFVIVLVKTRKLPRCLVSFIASLGVAYGAFYWYTLIPLYDLYTFYAPRYAEFTVPSNWPQMFGIPLMLTAVAGVGVWAYKTKATMIEYEWLLLMWLVMPLVLGYAYLLGVQWHAVRWLYFLQQPACVWSGIAISKIRHQKIAIIAVIILFALQWVSTMQGYYSDIAANALYSY
jgi:hypothetical protein